MRNFVENCLGFEHAVEVTHTGMVAADDHPRAAIVLAEGSVQRSDDSLEVRFDITDFQSTVPVVYVGILPDLFDEGQGAVASGELDDAGVLRATEVLAKHDENYMPPEVADALKKSGQWQHMRDKLEDSGQVTEDKTQ